jgi:hypothetical protein
VFHATAVLIKVALGAIMFLTYEARIIFVKIKEIFPGINMLTSRAGNLPYI